MKTPILPDPSHSSKEAPHLTLYLFISFLYVGDATCKLTFSPANQSSGNSFQASLCTSLVTPDLMTRKYVPPNAPACMISFGVLFGLKSGKSGNFNCPRDKSSTISFLHWKEFAKGHILVQGKLYINQLFMVNVMIILTSNN